MQAVEERVELSLEFGDGRGGCVSQPVPVDVLGAV